MGLPLHIKQTQKTHQITKIRTMRIHRYYDENSENLDENAILNQDNVHLYDTSKTVEAKSDQQSNRQKDALISPNSTISVPSSQNEDNYAIEEG